MYILGIFTAYVDMKGQIYLFVGNKKHVKRKKQSEVVGCDFNY